MSEKTEVRRNASTRAVITRANGEKVDLGVIDRQYANPVRHWLWQTFCKHAANRRIARANKRAKGA